MAYWIARNNQKVGPYSLADAQRMLVEGKLLASDLAWTDGMANWRSAFEVIPEPATPELPPPPVPEPLAVTRIIPVMRTPEVPLAQPAVEASEPAPERTAAFEAALDAAARSAAVSAEPVQPVAAAGTSIPTWTPPASHQATTPSVAPTVTVPMAPNPALSPQPFATSAAPAVAPQPELYQPPPPAVQPQYSAPQMASAYAPPPPPPPPASAYQPYMQQPAQAYPGAVTYQAPPPPGVSAIPAGGLVPPGMHWGLLLLLGTVTLGLFYLYWVFKQASFVQRLDPTNPAKKLYTLMLVVIAVYIAVVAGAVASGSTSLMATITAVAGLVDLVLYALSLYAIFKMRSSLINYYNSVEPIGLRLSGVMTFFFNILYFQHHFHRIAQWKQTGVLVPQK